MVIPPNFATDFQLYTTGIPLVIPLENTGIPLIILPNFTADLQWYTTRKHRYTTDKSMETTGIPFKKNNGAKILHFFSFFNQFYIHVFFSSAQALSV